MKTRCYYWRDKSDFEIDCIIEKDANNIIPVEIKVSKSADTQVLKKLLPWNKLTETKPENNVLLYGGDEDWDMKNGRVLSWKSGNKLL